MNEKILIPDKNRFEKIKENIKKGGFENLSVFTDFDRTLTYGTVRGKKTPSMIAVLRVNNDYLGKDYSKKALLLLEKYEPIEFDFNIDEKEKRKAMEEWWREHINLLVEKKLNKKHFKKIVDERSVSFRDNTKAVFNLLKKHDVPMIIISASGLGEEPISMMIKKELGDFPNTYIISNSFYYDKDGNITGYKDFLIHTMNKDEVLLKERNFYEKIRDRKNLILLGDSFDDVKMANNIDYENIIKVCFLTQYTMEKIDDYKKLYDVLILNDSSMDFVKELLLEIENFKR